MTFTKAEHKELFIQLFKQANFPGHLLDFVMEVKKELEAAEIVPIPEENKKS